MIEQNSNPHLVSGGYPVLGFSCTSVRLGDLPAQRLALLVPLESLRSARRLGMIDELSKDRFIDGSSDGSWDREDESVR